MKIRGDREVMICCCSLAGTAACKTCPNNLFREEPSNAIGTFKFPSEERTDNWEIPKFMQRDRQDEKNNNNI